MFNITLEQGYSFTTMAVVAAVAILLCGLFYYRTFGTLSRRQWQTLLALRILAILLIILLLFRPVFSYHKDLKEQPAVIFLLDTSASMSIADDASGLSRFARARAQLQNWWGTLREDFNLHLVEFAERARTLEDVKELAILTPEGKATSLSRALVVAAKRLPRKDVEAVILLSDGIHNSARNPLEVAVKMGIVVHTVGVGASLRTSATHQDIQVTGMDCPDRMMLNNKARITASIEGIGLAGHVTTVFLEEDGKTLDETELTLDDVEGAQEVAFELRPTKKGRHAYTVRVEPAGQEKIEENNRRSAVAMVVEPGIRVLYVEGTLRAEYGALVDRFLAKDPDLEFCALVQTRPNFFLRRTNMEGLALKAIPADEKGVNMFDVFIVGDLDSSYLRTEQQELFVKRIREGAGLMMLGGYHSLGPGGYAGTPLGEVLPLLLGTREVGQITEPFLPELTPDGARHPIFANIAEYFPTKSRPAKVAGLPPLDGCTRVEAPRPGATVLAVYPVTTDAMPVLAVQPLDKGRTAVFCGDTTRAWQQGPRALGRDSPFLQFWGQTVRWLAGRKGAVAAEAGVTATTDKGFYEPEEPVRMTAIVRDQQGEGTDRAKVIAKIRGPAGRPEQVTLTTVPGPGGHYASTFEPKTAGPYEIVIEARLGESTLVAEKLSVEVGRPNLEFEKLDLDDKMLGRIAADTGGRYMHVTTADHLIQQLDRTQRKKRIALSARLYWPPLFWALFVGVLTTEWVLRRRFQLR